MKRRVLSFTVTLALCLNLCPVWVLAAGEEAGGGLCPHHPVHTDECGYIPPALEQACTHNHDEDCYTAETNCIHQHTAECYPASEGDPTEGEQAFCTHMCTEDSGCVVQTLSCSHQHDEICGYVPENPGAPCTFVCRLCPIEDLIGKLPPSISASNSEQVQVQLSEIYALYEELTGDEQQQVDLSPCASLLDQMEGMDAAVQSDTSRAAPAEKYTLGADETFKTPRVVSNTLILDTNGHTLSGTGSYILQVTGTGKLYLKGNYSSNPGGGVEVQSGGLLSVTEPDTQIFGYTYALDIASGADVQLSTGTYMGYTAAIQVANDDFAALLAPGCAYFDESGKPFPLSDTTDLKLARKVVVGPCDGHAGKSCAHNPGATQHTWTCPACGWAEPEACTFNFDPTGTGVCVSCNSEINILVDQEKLKELAYDDTVKPPKDAVAVRMKDASAALVPDTDYTVSYETRANVGSTTFTVTVTVTGKTYGGTFTKEYTFQQSDLTKPVLQWDTTAKPVPIHEDYTGSPVTIDKLPDVIINITSSVDLHDRLQYAHRVSGSGAAYTDGLPTNAGTYEVVVSLPDGPDYQAASSAPITLFIDPINPIDTAPAAKTLTFNRTAQELVTAGTLKSAAEGDGAVILYAASENGSYSTTIPTGTDAGGYEVWYKVEGGNNYNAVGPTKIDVNIRRKPITPVVELSQDKYQYDGDWKVPGVTVKDSDDKTVLKNDEYTVEYKDNRNVGTAKVIIDDKPGGNYAIKKVEVSFQIAAREQTPLSIMNQPSRVQYGDTFTLSAMGGSSTKAVEWKSSDTATATIDSSGNVEVKGTGKVTITATRPADSNYSAVSTTWTFTAKPKPVIAVVTAKDKTYDGDAAATVTATLQSGDLVDDDIIKITLSGSFEDPDAGTGKRVNVISTNPQFSVDSKGQANYIITYPSTATASIYKANITNVTAPVVKSGLEYTSNPQTLVTAGSAVGGTLEYSQDGGITYSESLPTGTAAKGYDIWYRVKGDRNHNDIAGTQLGTVTISQQKVPSPIIELTPSNSASYDGQVHRPSVTVKDKYHRVIPVEEYTVTYGNTDWISVGDHMVTVTGNGGGNYDIKEVEVPFQITAREQTPLSIGNQPGGVQYGDTFTLSATGGSSTKAVEWKSDHENIAKIDNSGNVEIKGTGAVTITATRPADSNYSAVSATWSFNAEKKPVTAVVTAQDKTYDGSADATVTATLQSGDLVGTDAVTLTVSGEFATADVGTDKQVTITSHNASGTNADKYAINWPDSATASILRGEAKLDPSDRPAAAADLTYTGNSQDLLSKGGSTVDGVGTIEYSLSQNGEYSTTIPTAVNAGTYTVWYKVADSENYQGFGPTSIEVEIKKADPTISTPPTASTITTEQSLNDSTLTGGQGSVDGSFAWKDGSIKPAAGTSQQDVVFTPKDTANYNTVTFQVQVEVTAPPSPDTGSDGSDDSGSSDGTSSSAPTDSRSMQTTIQDGTAETVVSDAAVNNLVQQAAASQSKSIVIKPEITGDVTKTQVSIPASTLSQIKNDMDLTVSTPVADVTIPSAALEALSGADGTVDVTAEQVGQTVVLTLTAGGEKVENISGGVTFSVPMEDTQPGTVAVLVHEDGTREVVRKSVAGEGKVNVPLDGSATIEIVEDNSRDYTDVSSESWAADAVAFASAHELFRGTSDTTFSPNKAMSRGMVTTVLYNLEGGPKQEQTSGFSDVSSSAWYADSVTWAAAKGIVEGDENGRFGPNDSLTREEFVVMLWKYAGSPEASNQNLNFADADQVSSSAQEALCWAAENGIINGYASGQLAPKGTATRAQAAQMLKNFMENT